MNETYRRISAEMRKDVRKHYVENKTDLEGMENMIESVQTIALTPVEEILCLGTKFLLVHSKNQLGSVRNIADVILNLRDMIEEQRDTMWKLTNQIESLAKGSTNKKLTNRILEEVVTIKEDMKKMEKSQTTKINDTRKDMEELSILHDLADDLKKKLEKKKRDEDEGD